LNDICFFGIQEIIASGVSGTVRFHVSLKVIVIRCVYIPYWMPHVGTMGRARTRRLAQRTQRSQELNDMIYDMIFKSLPTMHVGGCTKSAGVH